MTTGIALVAAEVLLLVAAIRLFVHHGEGTLAPWDPTQHLVVLGAYRHARDPMHVGVLLVLYGEGVLMGSLPILVFATAVVILHLFYIPLSEERGLEERLGEAYLEYKRHDPRWIPRIDPWDAGGPDPTIKDSLRRATRRHVRRRGEGPVLIEAEGRSLASAEHGFRYGGLKVLRPHCVSTQYESMQVFIVVR